MSNFPQNILESNAPKICLIAAPGCGKTTKVLIPKAQAILKDAEIDPSQVLLLTFSRMSALDLKGKVEQLDRKSISSTVHAFCLAFLLSEDNHDIRKRVECILLDFQTETLLSDLKLTFKDNKRALRQTLREFSAAWAIKPHDETFEEGGSRKAFKTAVINWLEEYQAVLMEEIVYGAVHLARQLESTQFLERPKHIFVDEYQDLNKLEQEFIDILARKSESLLVVGDPDQSVYGFKHAHHNGIVEFSKRPDVEGHTHLVTLRCPKEVVKRANELLTQADPIRKEVLVCREEAIDGEVHFVQQSKQDMEFGSVLQRISRCLRHGCKGKDIIVLSPRSPLAFEFARYAERNKDLYDIPKSTEFVVTLRPVFSDEEQEKILRFALLVKPDSLAHIRSYIGIGDNTKLHFAKEVALLKQRYGAMAGVLEGANADDWPRVNTRVKSICERLKSLREFLEKFKNIESAEAVLKTLFTDDPALAKVKRLFEGLLETGDTPKKLYDKFVDHIRTLSADDTSVRIMSLMASKGLEAEHVFIIGCNAGNIPGEKRIEHMTELEHKNEQRRLLFVGFTRARQTLTVSWSRNISYQQSKRHKTKSVRTWRRSKQPVESTVAICDFIGDLSKVDWEK